jgi:hypothetical protein
VVWYPQPLRHPSLSSGTPVDPLSPRTFGRRLLTADNLILLPMLLVAAAWCADYVGCQLGREFGFMAAMVKFLRPLVGAITIVLVLIGVVLLAVSGGNRGAGFLLVAVAMHFLPALYTHYAPAACVVPAGNASRGTNVPLHPPGWLPHKVVALAAAGGLIAGPQTPARIFIEQ